MMHIELFQDAQVKKRSSWIDKVHINVPISTRQQALLASTYFLRDFTTSFAVVIDSENFACIIGLLDEKHFPFLSTTVTSLDDRKKLSIGDSIRFIWKNYLTTAKIDGLAKTKEEAAEYLIETLDRLKNASMNQERLDISEQEVAANIKNEPIDFDGKTSDIGTAINEQMVIVGEGHQAMARDDKILINTEHELKKLTEKSDRILSVLNDLVLKVNANAAEIRSLRRSVNAYMKSSPGRIEDDHAAETISLFDLGELTYRGVDVTDDVNNIIKLSKFNKIVVGFARFMWGDRNLRFWRVVNQKHEVAPVDVSTNDNTPQQRGRGRPRVLNNKDPEGVALFRKVMIHVINTQLARSDVASMDKGEIDTDKQKKASYIDQTYITLNQWGTDARSRDVRSDDCVYWRLLDRGLKPSPNWDICWELIPNERKAEEKDAGSRPSIILPVNESIITLRQARCLGKYYDDVD